MSECGSAKSIAAALNPHVLASDRAIAKRALHWPWCWPTDPTQTNNLQRTLSLDQTPPRPGVAPLLAYLDQEHGEVFAIDLSGIHGQLDARPVDDAFNRAWVRALHAVPRTLPVLWDPLTELITPPAAFLVAYLQPPSEAPLSGESFGLAFALAIASKVLGAPLPQDVAMTGTVDAYGEVGPVEGIATKIRTAARCCPQLRRVLVPMDNLEEARCHAHGLAIHGVATLSEAYALAFGDELEASFKAQDLAAAQARAHRLFLFALDSAPQSTIDWRPVAAAAQSILRDWGQELDAVHRAYLEQAGQIARRHKGESYDYVAPPRELIESLYAPQRVNLIAHWVQSAADRGRPSFANAEALALEHLQRGREAFAPHLRLLGALGRLYGLIRERAAEGLACQLEAAGAWIALGCGAEATYPLSAAFRLAGALEDLAAFDQAENLYAQARSTTFMDAGEVFVRAARAGALRFLPETAALSRAEAAKCLESLAARSDQRPHLRLMALRCAFGLVGDDDHRARVEKLEASLRATLDAKELWLRYDALRALERAVASGSQEEQARALTTLEALRAQPTGWMAAHAEAHGLPVAAEVLRFWPY